MIGTAKRLTLLGLSAVALAAMPAVAQIRMSDGFTFLKAVRDGDGAKAQEIANNPSSTAINARDARTGEGALHIVVRRRDQSWLNYLLSRGARPDIQMNDGTTPLVLAAQLGWADGITTLLARGANVNLGNNQGETPLMFAVRERNIPVIRLLLARGADPAKTDNVSGYSALDYARQDSRSASIVRLLEEGARNRARTMVGPTR